MSSLEFEDVDDIPVEQLTIVNLLDPWRTVGDEVC